MPSRTGLTKRDIIAQLRSDSRIDADEISVELIDGKVQLTGYVHSLAELNAVELATLGVRGVSDIDNRLEIRYSTDTTPINDKKIKGDIEKLLQLNNSVDETKIGADVQDGIVTIEGTVDSYWKKERVGEVVGELYGVFTVANKLTVVPTDTVADRNIAAEIDKTLDRMELVDLRYVTVHVQDGVVELTGKVVDRNARVMAGNVARNTKGVREIRNNLIIT